MNKRNTQQRRRSILDLLAEQGEVSVDDLALRFETSEVTIRKDLTALEDNGLLLRRYGGAVQLPHELISEAVPSAISARKQALAKAAAALIKTTTALFSTAAAPRPLYCRSFPPNKAWW